MADDRYRGLLTDREREILAGEADVSDNYRYRVVSRIRTKIDRLDSEMEFLAEYHPGLLNDLTDTVCGSDSDPDPGSEQ